MMQIESDELEGEYKTILASDGKLKSLFAVLNIYPDGKSLTLFSIELNGKLYSRLATLQDAVNVFNRI